MPSPPPDFAGMAKKLFPDMHTVHRTVLLFRLECIAHRLLKSGWEPQVNCYCSRELVILAYMMPLQCRAPLLHEALERAMAEGNQTVLSMAQEIERAA